LRAPPIRVDGATSDEVLAGLVETTATTDPPTTAYMIDADGAHEIPMSISDFDLHDES
jgi:hypothetical protein